VGETQGAKRQEQCPDERQQRPLRQDQVPCGVWLQHKLAGNSRPHCAQSSAAGKEALSWQQ